MEMRTRGEVKAGGGAVLGTGVALRLSSALRGGGLAPKGCLQNTEPQEPYGRGKKRRPREQGREM